MPIDDAFLLSLVALYASLPFFAGPLDMQNVSVSYSNTRFTYDWTLSFQDIVLQVSWTSNGILTLTDYNASVTQSIENLIAALSPSSSSSSAAGLFNLVLQFPACTPFTAYNGSYSGVTGFVTLLRKLFSNIRIPCDCRCIAHPDPPEGAPPPLTRRRRNSRPSSSSSSSSSTAAAAVPAPTTTAAEQGLISSVLQIYPVVPSTSQQEEQKKKQAELALYKLGAWSSKMSKRGKQVLSNNGYKEFDVNAVNTFMADMQSSSSLFLPSFLHMPSDTGLVGILQGTNQLCALVDIPASSSPLTAVPYTIRTMLLSQDTVFLPSPQGNRVLLKKALPFSGLGGFVSWASNPENANSQLIDSVDDDNGFHSLSLVPTKPILQGEPIVCFDRTIQHGAVSSYFSTWGDILLIFNHLLEKQH